MEQLLSEFVRVKHTGDERPTEMEQVVFDGDTAAPRKEDHDKDKTKSPVQNGILVTFGTIFLKTQVKLHKSRY